MRDQPTVISNDKDITPRLIEFRRGMFGGGDWYVTWVTRSRPWEVSCMRLPLSDNAGRTDHHGRTIDYRVHWHTTSTTNTPHATVAA